MKRTLIILDWDDTLFPTSWVRQNKIDLNHPRNQMKYSYLFNKLDRKIYNILSGFMKYGKVVIITNAMLQWVNMCSNVLPLTKDLFNGPIKVFSARENYSATTDSSLSWKVNAFSHHFDKHFMDNKHKWKEIISIGDAHYEHIALVNLYNIRKTKRGDRFLKSIRFMSKPTYDQLMDQLNILERCIDKICTKRKHIELMFKN